MTLDEAVRHLTERDYAVAEVTQRLGVWAPSLYRQHASDLVETRGEILKLLHCTHEERDLREKEEPLVEGPGL